MARLPTRDDLPQAVPTPAGGIVGAPDNKIGQSIQTLGLYMGRQAVEDRKKQGVMERARATAMLQSGLIESSSNYTPQNKPDVTKWSDDFYKGSTRLREEAAKLISDPNERELFMLQAEDDLTRYNVNISQNAQKIQNERHLETTTLSMDQILDAAATTEDEEERIALLAKYRGLSKDLVDANLMSPAKAADLDVKGRQKVAALVVQKQILKSPGVAYGALTGEPTENFLHKTLGKENSRRDPTARPRYTKGPKKGQLMSSALGLFQFTHDTWERLRKNNRDLGLSPSYGKVDNPNDGRLDNDQQMRAMRALTKENAASLRKNGLPVTEATLYLAHFAGAGGAAKLLSADPGARAEVLFPAEAKANPRHFVGKTVGEAIASLTKGMDGQPIKVGPEYASLSPEQRIVLERQARSAADQQWNQSKDEFETDMLATLADEAMMMDSREESLKYLQEADGSASVKLKAEPIINQRWNAKNKIKEERRQEEWQQTFKAVQDGMDAGVDPVSLKNMADKLTDQNDRQTLNKFILEGPPKKDTDALINRIDTLRYSNDPEDQKKFIEMDLTTPEMLSGLTSASRQEMFRQQAAARKAQLPDGSSPELMTIANIRDSYPVQLGLEIKGANPDPEDVAVWSVIQGNIQMQLNAFTQQNGKPPDTAQAQQIADQAIISWHQSTKTGGIWGFNQDDTPMAKAISDRYGAMPAKDRPPLSALWRTYLSELQAHNQKTGKNLQPNPSFFMENYLK
jgi:hypothetical protein